MTLAGVPGSPALAGQGILAPLLKETTLIKGGLFIVINNEFINKAPVEFAGSGLVFEPARLRSRG
jgi:hypothetical protein